MSKLAMPKIDRKKIYKKNIIIKNLKKIIKRENILDHEDQEKPFETDGLSAYKQKPMAVVFPENTNWINAVDQPPVIMTGGTFYPPTTDWLDTLTWIKMNTPENAVIASWWDYGYWITTLSDRTTLVDNATLGTKQIKTMAKILMNSPDDSWNILKEMNVDYVVVFVAANDIGSKSTEMPLYELGGGGDESKIYWFSKIAELPVSNYLNSNGIPTNNFYENNI